MAESRKNMGSDLSHDTLRQTERGLRALAIGVDGSSLGGCDRPIGSAYFNHPYLGSERPVILFPTAEAGVQTCSRPESKPTVRSLTFTPFGPEERHRPTHRVHR